MTLGDHLVHKLCRRLALICLVLEGLHLLPEPVNFLGVINRLLLPGSLLLLVFLYSESGAAPLTPGLHQVRRDALDSYSVNKV